MRYMVSALCLFAMLAPASAGAKPRAKEQLDPNRMICRTEEELGSRLSRKRRCLTAAQWDEIRRDERMVIERGQLGKKWSEN
jgi:hypothetical protein